MICARIGRKTKKRKKYVMKSCKNIFAAVGALLLLSGCLHDKYPETTGGSGAGKTTVAFSVTTPPSLADGMTRLNGGKLYGDNIGELDVFLIEAGSERIVGWESISQDRIGAWDTDYKTFKVSFDVPDRPVTHKLVVLANSYGLLTQKVFSGMNFDDRGNWITGYSEHWLRERLSISSDPDRYYENLSVFAIKGNPMWGETSSTFTLPVETIPTIQLLRPHARIDVEIDPSNTFAMTEYMLPYAFEYLKIIPEHGNYSHAARKINWPDFFPSDNTWSVSENLESESMFCSIAVGDYPNADLWRPEFVILVKGRYGPSGTEGWHKVKIEDDFGNRMNILRNHQYHVTVRDVTGPGYPTPGEALESSVYLLADIEVWNEATQSVMIEGDHYLRISRTSFSIAKENFRSLPVTFETNYPGAGDKSGIGSNYAEGLNIRTLNSDWLSFSAIDISSPYKYVMRVVAEENKTGAQREGAIEVRAGNMKYKIHITQSTESWLTVEPEVVVDLDGLYHKIDVDSDVDWTAQVSGGIAEDLEKFIPVTMSSAEDRNGVYFRTTKSLTYTRPFSVNLKFTGPEYPNNPVTMTVKMCKLTLAESNCYIVKPSGNSIAFPVSIANKTSLGQQIFEGETVDYKIIWSDLPVPISTNNIQTVRVLGRGPDAYIYVQTGSKSGNAVIAATTKRRPDETWIEEEDVVRWSWHIWVTDYDPDASSQTFMSEQGIEVTTMDRSLGAMRGNPGAYPNTADWKMMRGLYYQWGRKDAFPLDIPVYDADGSTNIEVSTKLDYNPKLGIMYPLCAYKGSSWNGFDGHNTWGTYGVKTVHDPCPAGWKIPFYNYWGRSDTTTDGTGTYKNVLTSMGASVGNVSGDTSCWWMYWPGYGGYFAGQGLRNTAGSFLDISNETWGYQWCGIGQSLVSGKFSFSYSDSASNNSGICTAYLGQNIRCVKE